MTSFKDHFSNHAKEYSDFRPTYPKEVFEFLASQCSHHELVWDCATGNGQSALALTSFFDKVQASDASAEQIKHAIPHNKVTYHTWSAEASELPDNSVDLITVSQALHWFNFDLFYKEAKRVLKKNGVLAAWCYELFNVRNNEALTEILRHIYNDIAGPHWPDERAYVEQHYNSIPFPFEESKVPNFAMITEWDFETFCGYIKTWSASKIYHNATGQDVLHDSLTKLKTIWGDQETYTLEWPLYFRLGKV